MPAGQQAPDPRARPAAPDPARGWWERSAQAACPGARHARQSRSRRARPTIRGSRPPEHAERLIDIGSEVCARVGGRIERAAGRPGRIPGAQSRHHGRPQPAHGDVCTRCGGLHPIRGRNRSVGGPGLHPVRGSAPGMGAESVGSGLTAPVPGADPHPGCTVAVTEALSAPVPGANPRNGCTPPRQARLRPRPVERRHPPALRNGFHGQPQVRGNTLAECDEPAQRRWAGAWAAADRVPLNIHGASGRRLAMPAGPNVLRWSASATTTSGTCPPTLGRTPLEGERMSDSASQPTDHGLTGRVRWVALLFLALGVAMIILDATVVNVAIPYDRGGSGPLDNGRGVGQRRRRPHLRLAAAVGRATQRSGGASLDVCGGRGGLRRRQCTHRRVGQCRRTHRSTGPAGCWRGDDPAVVAVGAQRRIPGSDR